MNNFDHRTELKTEDGYEIESYNHYGDPSKGRGYTVWPPEGNAVGDYKSLRSAKQAIRQWKLIGDPMKLFQDGGARFQVLKVRRAKK